MSEPRKWWIVYAKLSPRISVFDAKPNSMESIEVIESRAFDAMKAENARLKALLGEAVEALKGYYECTMCKARTEKKWGRSCSVIDGVCLWRKVDHAEFLAKLQEASK